MNHQSLSLGGSVVRNALGGYYHFSIIRKLQILKKLVKKCASLCLKGSKASNYAASMESLKACRMRLETNVQSTRNQHMPLINSRII